MGVDLTLLPLDVGRHISHTVLSCVRNREQFDAIVKLPSFVAGRIRCYCARGQDGDPSYGVATCDPYGSVLRKVQAGALKAVGLHGPVGAYVAAMDDADEIVLYWH